MNPVVLLWAGGERGGGGGEDINNPPLRVFLRGANPRGGGGGGLPGGGYQHLAFDKEGTDVARWLNARGVAAFVLKYRLGPKYHHPIELGDAQRAVRVVRGGGYGVRQVGVWGFSAGGHLAASVGTMWDGGKAGAADAVERESCRPDFLVLGYPVITMEEPFVHTGSRDNLLGIPAPAALVEEMSLEKRVTSDAPPTFLFTTTDDKTVPVMNSVMFYSALVEKKVPAELHIFQQGPHGVGLAPGFPDLKGWPDLVATWMRARGYMGAP